MESVDLRTDYDKKLDEDWDKIEELCRPTIILCGKIGFGQHLLVGMCIKAAESIKENPVKLYERCWTPTYPKETIGHCEHVKQFLLDGTWQI